MNIFRIQFKMERLVPDSMTGAYDEAYLQNLTTVSCSSAKENILGIDEACRWSMPSLMRVSMLSWTPITMADCEYLEGLEVVYYGDLNMRMSSNLNIAAMARSCPLHLISKHSGRTWQDSSRATLWLSSIPVSRPNPFLPQYHIELGILDPNANSQTMNTMTWTKSWS